MNRFVSFLFASALAATLVTGSANASPGHDHSHDEAPAAAAGPASPRFEAHSDLFEAVGTLEGEALSVFVDRYADNAPVLKATVELESGETKAVGKFHEELGDYSFAAAAFNKPGSYPITLTITAGNDVDVLAGNLVVPDVHANHDHEEAPAWQERARTWGFAAAAVLALAWIASRLIKRRKAKGLK